MDADLTKMTEKELDAYHETARNGHIMATEDMERTARFKQIKASVDEWERRYALQALRVAR